MTWECCLIPVLNFYLVISQGHTQYRKDFAVSQRNQCIYNVRNGISVWLSYGTQSPIIHAKSVFYTSVFSLFSALRQYYCSTATYLTLLSLYLTCRLCYPPLLTSTHEEPYTDISLWVLAFPVTIIRGRGSRHPWNVRRLSFYTAVHPRRQFWTPSYDGYEGHIQGLINRIICNLTCFPGSHISPFMKAAKSLLSASVFITAC
jgi:hypothetical protein